MTEKQMIAKETVGYSTSLYVSQVIAIIKGFVIAKFLGPSMYGTWQVLNIILSYSSNSHLGILHGMNKEIPYYRGKEDLEKVEETKNTAFGSVFLMSIFVSIFLIAISFFLKDTYFIGGIRIVAGIILFNQLYFFYGLLLRANKKFILLAKRNILFASINLIAIICLIVKYKIYGALFALLSAYIIIIFWLLKKGKEKFKFQINFEETLRLLKIGGPILVIGFGYTILSTVDKWMIVAMIDKTNLGYYGIAMAISGLIYFVPNTVGWIMYPRLLEKYGENDDIESLKNRVFIPTLILMYLTPFMIGALLIVIHLPVNYILPKYIPALSVVNILLPATFFMSVIRVGGNFLITINKHYNILVIQIISIILSLSLNYLFIKSGMGIIGVALGTAITYFFYGSAIMGSTLKQYTDKVSEFIKFFIKGYIPFAYTLGIVLILNFFIKTPTDLYHDICTTLIKLIFFIILNSPLLYYINRKTAVLSEIFRVLKLAGVHSK